eukprot:CAMPEP_0116885458 /NCGR_PEP_ID=MMETSP0463-20121206/18804_1 /TAXON_ID=181622 /ORGANISM="Strombidinopsis sp, Strain SopsisLIS2011" /LENGTH=69 /DNA_ID=CAMNT_0004543891 /DNA_START=143 /DNA_END=352 /DNA_ORIENTATION=-
MPTDKVNMLVDLATEVKSFKEIRMTEKMTGRHRYFPILKEATMKQRKSMDKVFSYDTSNLEEEYAYETD